MKGMENLQEKLKNLPKYTLNNEQKENIMLALKNESKYKEREYSYVIPFIFISINMCDSICPIYFR